MLFFINRPRAWDEIHARRLHKTHKTLSAFCATPALPLYSPLIPLADSASPEPVPAQRIFRAVRHAPVNRLWMARNHGKRTLKKKENEDSYLSFLFKRRTVESDEPRVTVPI